ncbi:MAG: putative acetolactate synthase large subunit [Pseudonocardiales bacterium]|nr:putative acetolactate synthase large subunit [Pseudonocardiales bacterium]
MTITVADALAIAVRRHGVTDCFGQSLPSAFFLAAPKHGLRQISYRTENAGAAMADGYARISHRTTVVGAQNGPAATLLVPPFAEALKASVPIVGFVQDIPRSGRDRNAFQELDHFELFKGCTKWVRQLNDPSRVDDYVDMVFAAATSGRPGPAVLLLPKDLLLEPVTGNAISGPRTASLAAYPLDRTRPDHEAVVRAADLLAAAERPLIIAGGGVHLSDASAALSRLSAAASLPVATTTMGKGSVSELDPLSIGVIGSFMAPYARTHRLRDYVRTSDVIVLVGSRTNENGTDTWQLLPRDATFIHIDVDPEELGRNYEAVRMLGDARLALDDLAAELARRNLSLREQARPALVGLIEQARIAHRSDVAAVAESTASPIRPERVMAELDALLDGDEIVVSDASYSTIWMAAFLTARQAGQRFISPRGLAGLGWGLPLALGAKAARPDSIVVCLAGDGGFAHVWAELETSMRENLPITLILFNNSILGFQKHAELNQFGAYTTAIPFTPVDHAAIARAAGADGMRVEDPDQLGAVLKEALGSSRTTLIEIMTDPNAYPPITAWQGKEGILIPSE